MTTAALYCRLSRRTDVNAPNLDQQEGILRGWAQDAGHEVVGVFRDYGESAFDGHHRPEYVALLEAVRSGTVDVVYAVDPDRLWRDTIDQALFLRDAAAAGVQAIVTSSGRIDPASPTDEMTATILAAVGRYESAVKQQRILRKHRQLAEAGKVSGGGTRPYGYTADRRHVVDHEARVVRRIVAEVIAGRPPKTIATALNAERVPTVTGRPWRGHVVRTLATSWRIAGVRSHHGRPVADAEWPAIVPRADVERARAVLRSRAGRPPSGRARRLLTGLVVCDCCGARMVSRPTAAGTPTYVVPQDPALGVRTHRRIQAEPLEELVVTAALEAVRAAADVDVGDGREVELAAQLDADRRLLADLGDRLGRGELSVEAFTAAEAAVRARVEAAEADLAALRLGGGTGEVADLAARWEELSHEDRRAVLAAVIEQVRVGPAVRGRNRFDPARVDVRWRA